jgi:hypothetical protein
MNINFSEFDNYNINNTIKKSNINAINALNAINNINDINKSPIRDFSDFMSSEKKTQKLRPSTAMFSVGSKISQKSDINKFNMNSNNSNLLHTNNNNYSRSRPQSSFNNKNFNHANANVNTIVNTNTITNNKLNESKRKKIELTSGPGPFLNIDYDELYRQPEIKDKKVKQILDEVNGFGPYYSHCNSCNKKNLDFYSKMDSNSAIKMLKTIKDYKK